MNNLYVFTLIGCTTTTDWKKESTNVESQSSDLSLPHSILYKMVKNPLATTLKNTTVRQRIKSVNFKNMYCYYVIMTLVANMIDGI